MMNNRDLLVSLLEQNEVYVTFTKVSGEERLMLCTLDPTKLPTQTDLEEKIQEKTRNPDICAVYDLEKNGWRSFRFDSVTSVAIK